MYFFVYISIEKSRFKNALAAHTCFHAITVDFKMSIMREIVAAQSDLQHTIYETNKIDEHSLLNFRRKNKWFCAWMSI